jgi:hypothetical protein
MRLLRICVNQRVISKRAADLIVELGMIAAAIQALASRKPASTAKSFEEYQDTLGPIEPDEPVIAVKVNLMGTRTLKKEEEREYAVLFSEGTVTTKVSLLDIPQDEFFFLKGLHRGSFEIGQALPPYYYGMGIMHAQTLVEVYLEDMLELVYEVDPSLMPESKVVRAHEQFVLDGNTSAATELRQKAAHRALRLPLPAIAKGFRETLGFAELDPVVDEPLQRSSLLRNCIAHGSIVSPQLAGAFPAQYQAGATLVPDQVMFQRALSSYQGFVFALELARPQAIAAREEPAFCRRERAA